MTRTGKTGFSAKFLAQKHKCPYCEKGLKTEATLRSHLSRLHSEKASFSCHFCHVNFKTSLKLRKHAETRCDMCGYCNENHRFNCDKCPESPKTKKDAIVSTFVSKFLQFEQKLEEKQAAKSCRKSTKKVSKKEQIIKDFVLELIQSKGNSSLIPKVGNNKKKLEANICESSLKKERTTHSLLCYNKFESSPIVIVRKDQIVEEFVAQSQLPFSDIEIDVTTMDDSHLEDSSQVESQVSTCLNETSLALRTGENVSKKEKIVQGFVVELIQCQRNPSSGSKVGNNDEKMEDSDSNHDDIKSDSKNPDCLEPQLYKEYESVIEVDVTNMDDSHHEDSNQVESQVSAYLNSTIHELRTGENVSKKEKIVQGFVVELMQFQRNPSSGSKVGTNNKKLEDSDSNHDDIKSDTKNPGCYMSQSTKECESDVEMVEEVVTENLSQHFEKAVSHQELMSQSHDTLIMCQICDKLVPQSELKDHVICCHVKAQCNKFNCHFCDIDFGEKEDFLIHLFDHLGLAYDSCDSYDAFYYTGIKKPQLDFSLASTHHYEVVIHDSGDNNGDTIHDIVPDVSDKKVTIPTFGAAFNNILANDFFEVDRPENIKNTHDFGDINDNLCHDVDDNIVKKCHTDMYTQFRDQSHAKNCHDVIQRHDLAKNLHGVGQYQTKYCHDLSQRHDNYRHDFGDSIAKNLHNMGQCQAKDCHDSGDTIAKNCHKIGQRHDINCHDIGKTAAKLCAYDNLDAKVIESHDSNPFVNLTVGQVYKMCIRGDFSGISRDLTEPQLNNQFPDDPSINVTAKKCENCHQDYQIGHVFAQHELECWNRPDKLPKLGNLFTCQKCEMEFAVEAAFQKHQNEGCPFLRMTQIDLTKCKYCTNPVIFPGCAECQKCWRGLNPVWFI